MSARTLAGLLHRIRACEVCAAHLPLGPRPTLRASETAKVLLIGQAPGTRVHQTGVPWNDPSGVRLRSWLQVADDAFYDERQIAIVPMGFCYPGRQASGGDSPPRPECAPLWHRAIRSALPSVRLTLLIGSYAQAYYLAKRRKATMGETVRAWDEYQPDFFPLPHPSWRTVGWQRRNPWFEKDVVPALRARVANALATPASPFSSSGRHPGAAATHSA